MTARSAPLSFELDPLIAEARRRARHRRLLAVLMIALGVAGAVLAFGPSGDRPGSGVIPGRPDGTSAAGRPRSGPLAWPKDSGFGSVGVPVRARQVGVLAIPLASTSHEAVLLDVRLQHATVSPGLTIRYAASTGHGLHVRADARVIGTDGEIGWPRVRWGLRPIDGFVVRPRTTAAVVIGASAAKPGVYRLMRSVVVDYRIGDVFYRAVVPFGFQLCVAVSCPAES